MTDFDVLDRKLALPDEQAAAAARAHWDSIAKPLNGLGEFEDMIVRIAALRGNHKVSIGRRAVAVLCADNGVGAEGVTQTDASVTATMAAQIRDHRSSVCLMARSAGADVFAHDMGMLCRVDGVPGCHIADGTGNIAKGPAMSLEQACRAIAYGIELAGKYVEAGYDIIVTGEMGIGNTSTSSAVASVLTGLPPEAVTGRGAGLSDEAYVRKLKTVKRAIEVNSPDADDVLGVLAGLGGFDIAGMTGIFIGGALYRIPVLIDGLISSVAALVAYRLCPRSRVAMLASHSSAEPAAEAILSELGLKAVLRAGMKLGEGTGAVCMLPLLDMALAVYNGSAAFSDTGIEQYKKLGGESK